jgi:hypothetical protein
MEHLLKNDTSIITNETIINKYQIDSTIINNKGWLELEKSNSTKLLCFYDGILPKHPIQKNSYENLDELENVEIIDNNLFQLKISNIIFYYLYDKEEIDNFGIKKCKYQFEVPLNDVNELNIQITKYCHDMKYCSKYRKYMYDE